MLRSIWCGLSPSPTESEPWGSKSTSRTLRPYSASEAPRLIVVVVLPTPPFWLHIEMTRALPWVTRGVGSGISGIGRPVGPSTPGAEATTAASGSGARGAMGSKGIGSVKTAASTGAEDIGAEDIGEEDMVSLGSLGGGGGGGGATRGGISGAAADPRPNRAPNRCAPSLMVVLRSGLC